MNEGRPELHGKLACDVPKNDGRNIRNATKPPDGLEYLQLD